MKVFYSYDTVTKLYLEDIHVEASLPKPKPPTPPSQLPPDKPFDPNAPVVTPQLFYVQPANTTDMQPAGFHTPKWNGTKWVEGGDPVVVAALKKEAVFSTNNQKTLESIAVLEAQQTPRLLRGATLADPWSVTKLKSLEAQISTLRKTLV